MGDGNLSFLPPPPDGDPVSINIYLHTKAEDPEAPSPPPARPSFYNYLRRQGKPDEWIERELRSLLTEAGFLRSEINTYFARHELPDNTYFARPGFSDNFIDFSQPVDFNREVTPEEKARRAELARLKPGAGANATWDNLLNESVCKRSLTGSLVYAGVQNAPGDYIPVPRGFGPRTEEIYEERKGKLNGPPGLQNDKELARREVSPRGFGQYAQNIPAGKERIPKDPPPAQSADPRPAVPRGFGPYHQHIVEAANLDSPAEVYLTQSYEYLDQNYQNAAASRPVSIGNKQVCPLNPNFTPHGFGPYSAKLQRYVDEARASVFYETEVPAIGLTQAEIESLPFEKRLALKIASQVPDLPIDYLGGLLTPGMSMLGRAALPGGLRGLCNYLEENGRPQDAFAFMEMVGVTVVEGFKGAAVGYFTGRAKQISAKFTADRGGNKLAQYAASATAEGIVQPAVEGALHGRLPTGRDYVDAVFTALLAGGAAPVLAAYGRQGMNKAAQTVENNLRKTYVLTAVPPWEAAADAAVDPAVHRALLDEQGGVAEKYVTERIAGVERGDVPASEIAPFQDRPDAQAALAKALARGEDVDADFGKLRPEHKQALNEIRRARGLPGLVGDNLIIPGPVVKRLYERGILKDGMTADEAAEILINASREGQDFASGPRHVRVQASDKLQGKLIALGAIVVGSRTRPPGPVELDIHLDKSNLPEKAPE